MKLISIDVRTLVDDFSTIVNDPVLACDYHPVVLHETMSFMFGRPGFIRMTLFQNVNFETVRI